MAIYGTIFLECRESFSRHEQEIEVWEMSRDLQWKKILKDGWIWIWCRKTSEIIPRNWLISIKSDGRKLKNAIVIRNKMVFIPLPVLNWSSHGEVRQRTNSSIFPAHIFIHSRIDKNHWGGDEFTSLAILKEKIIQEMSDLLNLSGSVS